MEQIAFSTELTWIPKAAVTKFIPRKGNTGLTRASTPEPTEPSWHGDRGIGDVEERLQQDKTPGQFLPLPFYLCLQVQPVSTMRSSGGKQTHLRLSLQPEKAG